jgi:1,4-dihydroxy-2-naphthoate octaprenyltransferase
MSLVFTAATSRAQVLIQAIRPRTLSMAFAPVLLGAAFAFSETGSIMVWPVLCCLVAAIGIQIGTNLFNDAADGARGHDGAGRIGPARVTASGLMTPAEVQRLGIVSFAVAVTAGLATLAVGGVPILLLGIASVLAGIAYSYGPRPISFTPFGEVFVVAFFGVAAVAGTIWLAAARISVTGMFLGVAVGLPAAAVLMVNNHRDRVADTRNGRRTLAILAGPDLSTVIYAALLIATPLLSVLLALVSGHAGLMATVFVLPLAVGLSRRLAQEPVGPGLNVLLGQTGLYQLVFAVLAGTGLVIEGLLR